MTILKRLMEAVRATLINKIFWIGFIICFAMFSKYILGSDNLLEQIGEKLAKDNFGVDVDFSPEVDK
jgi:hypothetical protein